MAGLSFSELQSLKLRRAPPPKVPLDTNPSQHGDFSLDTGSVSVAAFRNKFEQKLTSPTKVHVGFSSRQDGNQPPEGIVSSMASARAKFEQKPALPRKPPVPLKKSTAVQSKEKPQKLSNNSVFKGEPPRKELPSFFRIGAAGPRKKPKPANLKFMLEKYKYKIVLSNGANNVTRTSDKEEENEEIYDDIVSTLQGNQDDPSEEMYEVM